MRQRPKEQDKLERRHNFLPVEEKRNSEGKQENTESRCFLYAGLCGGLYTSGTALQSGLRLDETSEQNPEYAAVTGT